VSERRRYVRAKREKKNHTIYTQATRIQRPDMQYTTSKANCSTLVAVFPTIQNKGGSHMRTVQSAEVQVEKDHVTCKVWIITCRNTHLSARREQSLPSTQGGGGAGSRMRYLTSERARGRYPVKPCNSKVRIRHDVQAVSTKHFTDKNVKNSRDLYFHALPIPPSYPLSHDIYNYAQHPHTRPSPNQKPSKELATLPAKY